MSTELITTNQDLVNILLPSTNPSILTKEEEEDAERLNTAFRILGPAAGGALICPGNQEYTSEDEKCPYSSKCTLLKAKKAPQGELCPIEIDIIGSQFTDWVKQLERTAFDLSASERVFVSELVWLAVQEQRCSAIISKGTAAKLTQLNPKEVHPETLDPITWEKVIHSNVLRLDQISLNRSRLLKEWMLTPEQKAKQARWEGKSKNTDQSSKQSKVADKVRLVNNSDIIDLKDTPTV